MHDDNHHKPSVKKTGIGKSVVFKPTPTSRTENSTLTKGKSGVVSKNHQEEIKQQPIQVTELHKHMDLVVAASGDSEVEEGEIISDSDSDFSLRGKHHLRHRQKPQTVLKPILKPISKVLTHTFGKKKRLVGIRSAVKKAMAAEAAKNMKSEFICDLCEENFPTG